MVQLETEVKEIIRGVLFVGRQGKEEVVPEAELATDLGADSLDFWELALNFEKEYGIEIPDEEIEGLVTVGDAIDYIEKRVSGR